MCLDEITPHKGRGRYYLIISAPEEGLVLDVLADRKKTSLDAWFVARGAVWCAQVGVCCADMWVGYHVAAQAALPNARLVVDRFHLAQRLSFAVSQARRAIQKAATPEVKAVLKGARWLLLKNREHLTAEEGQTLATMLALSPPLQVCYALKEDLRAWFNTDCDRAQAEIGLNHWLERAETSGLPAWRLFVQMVETWRESLLNYFDGRQTNGFAEGVNLKIKLLNRRAFGYRNFESFRLHILVAFGQ